MWAERLRAERLPGQSAVLAAALLLPLLAAYALVERSTTVAVAVAALPLLLFAAAGLLTLPGRLVLLSAALVLPFTGQVWATRPLPTPGPALFPQDVIVGLAIGAGLFSYLTARERGDTFTVPRAAVLGWPFLVFGVAIVLATMRGHYAFGIPLFGSPMRFVFYAGIVFALVGVTPAILYRLLLWLFYTGTVVTVLFWMPYYIATGTSQTDQTSLSTGGERLLGISSSIYCAGALFLALLSLRLAEHPRARFLHLAMAGIAFVGVVAGFGRAVYVGVFVVCVVLVATSRSIRAPLLSALPLALPVLLLVAIFLPRVAPDLVEAAQRRVSAPPAQDENVQWRLRASEAVVEQVRSNPLLGVGFGATSEFVVDVESSSGFRVPVVQEAGQDPHNGYLYLWAGGGLLALGSFLLILVAFGRDVLRRLRSNDDPVARLVLWWSPALAFVFLLNATTGTSFSSPDDLLTIWTLLLLPCVVPLARAAAEAD